MSNPTADRILRYAIAGALAGVVIFLLLNPSISREERDEQRQDFGNMGEVFLDVWVHALMIGTVTGVVIGCSLVVAQESGAWSSVRLQRYLPTALGVGLFGGAVAGTIGQFAFSLLLFVNLIIARTVGWCLMGAVAGICPGAAYADSRKAWHGALGGAIGGGLGGLLFDVIAFATQGGSASRFLGFVTMGVATGAAVALVEEIAKEHWITILTGSREGKSYIISKPETTIGRDELADIPLFGDQTVQKQHAKLVKSDGALSIVAYPGLTVTVNSVPTSSASLEDGAVIGIGSHKLRFSTKARGTVPVQQPVVPVRPASYVPVQPSMLIVVAGPHTGQTFPLNVGSIVIGRDPACRIQLSQDGMVSRNHATLIWDGISLRVQDLGSTNGLFVNGQRVTEAVLSVGDTIGLGQSLLRVG